MSTENSQPESSSISGSQAMESSTVPPPVTSSVTIKLSPYWPSDPALWFSQVEAQVTTRNITSQKTKYAYVVGSLQPEVAQEVRDLLINPPAENPYTQLKKELVKRTSASDQQRLHQLLNAEQLGDRKPTQLFRRMQQLLGDSQLEPSIMKQLFLQRLPTNAQLILAYTEDDLDVESLAKLADKILEVAPTHSPSTLSTVVPQPATSTSTDSSASSTEYRQLWDMVSQLTTTINNLNLTLTSQHRKRPRSRSRSRPHRSPSPYDDQEQVQHQPEQQPRAPICWYHTKFRTSAKKCAPPCSFTPSTPGNANARR